MKKISKEIINKVNRMKKIGEEFQELNKQVIDYLNNKFCDIIEIEDRIGEIINLEDIPQTAQHNEDGTYEIYQQQGEDWGSGIIYIPCCDNQYLEIYYST